LLAASPHPPCTTPTTSTWRISGTYVGVRNSKHNDETDVKATGIAAYDAFLADRSPRGDGNCLPTIAFTMTDDLHSRMRRTDFPLHLRRRPVYGSAGAGMVAVVITHSGGKSRGIREDIMNGYLPYRETSPAARVGSIRGWQADILRGES
jgi:hypothetical protein